MLQQTGLSLLEARKVWWRSPEGRQEVMLIRAEDLLVQDSEGAYFNVQHQHLLFPEPPPLSQSDAMMVTFELHEPGQGLISYLTRSGSYIHFQAHVTGEKDDLVTLSSCPSHVAPGAS